MTHFLYPWIRTVGPCSRAANARLTNQARRKSALAFKCRGARQNLIYPRISAFLNRTLKRNTFLSWQQTSPVWRSTRSGTTTRVTSTVA